MYSEKGGREKRKERKGQIFGAINISDVDFRFHGKKRGE